MNPSIPAEIARNRRYIRARLKPRIGILGQADGTLYHPDRGYYWARWRGSKDANGNASQGQPFPVWAGESNYLPHAGRLVYIGTGLNGRLTILGAVPDDLVNAGFDARAHNPNDPYRQFVYLNNAVIHRSDALADEGNDTLKVNLNQLFYRDSYGQFIRWNGTDENTHLDLADYATVTPGSDEHQYGLVTLRTLENLPAVYVSTPKSAFLDLDFTDIQECISKADPECIDSRVWRIWSDQTTLVANPVTDLDMRQWINMPPRLGNPTVITERLRVRANHQLIYYGEVQVLGELHVLGEVVLLGIDEGPGGSSGMTDFTVAGDTGTPQTISNGNTLSVLGGTGLSSVAGATDTVTMNLDTPVALAHGGTHADLSATGGTNQFLKQSSTGADITVGAITDADVPNILTLTQINDTNGNEQVIFTTTASAVNEITVTNAAAGGNPKIEVTGGDTNAGLEIHPKGSDPVDVTGKFKVTSTLYPAHPSPSMTTTQRDASSPTTGDIIFNTSSNRFEFFDGQGWMPVGSLAPVCDLRMGTTAHADFTDATDFFFVPIASGVVYLPLFNSGWTPFKIADTPQQVSYQLTPTGNTTNGSATVTGVSSTYGLAKGMIITGTGITGGTTINSINRLLSTITLSAVATATNTGVTLTCTLIANKNYDVFLFRDNQSNSPAPADVIYGLDPWTNDTTRSTALATKDGVYLAGSSTGFNNARFIGTIRTNANSKFENQVLKRFVWNLDHPKPQPMRFLIATDTYSRTSTTIRQMDGSTANQFEVVTGLDLYSLIDIHLTLYGNTGGTACGVGLDTTTAFTTGNIGMIGFIALGGEHARYQAMVPLGYHVYSGNERGVASNTFLGDNGNPGFTQSGGSGWFEC